MKKGKQILALVLFLASSLGFLYFTGVIDNFARVFIEPSYLREVIEPYGVGAAFILIGLLLLNNIMWVIPGHGLGVASGLIYGPFLGTIVCFTGTTLSTWIALVLSKRYGRPFCRKMLGESRFRKYENLAGSHDVYPFVVLTLVPVVPDDLMVYLAGLTDISKKRLMIALCLARLPGVVVLVAFGDGLTRQSPLLLASVSLIIVISVILSLWKKDYVHNLSMGEYNN